MLFLGAAVICSITDFMLSFPTLSKVSPCMFICIDTDTPEIHFLASLKTLCFCLDFCYCFALSCFILEFCPGCASFWRTLWFPCSTTAQCKWHCTTIHTENNQLRSWPFIRSYWFLSFPSMYLFWQGVVTSCFYQGNWTSDE